jgi:hypothetical protein
MLLDAAGPAISSVSAAAPKHTWNRSCSHKMVPFSSNRL